MYRSYALGQYRTMYDNPIYRWRESVAVALSKLHDPPLSGYVAYRSIRDYLTAHGLALMPGEAEPLPSPAEREKLIYDPSRLERLFRAAAAVPVDPLLPPVPIVGNEKGESDFYALAFSLFGISLSALWKFYFLLLFASAAIFFLAFRSSPFCLLLLSIYLTAHYAMIGVASAPWIQTVHNSRFFSVMALLPSLHLLLLLLRRESLGWASGVLAAAQTLLLAFLAFCRFEVMWQPIAVIAVGGAVLPIQSLSVGLRRHGERGRAVAAGLLVIWPSLFSAGGVAGLLIYQRTALDHRAYALETRTHTFWEPLFSGTISANSELCSLYCFGEEPYSDTMDYIAVRDYLRRRSDATSPIAHVENGRIEINAMRNMGVYDAAMRRIFLRVVAQHPWLVLQSFVLDKPVDQVKILWHGRILARMGILVPVLLALVIGVIAAFLDASHGTSEQWLLVRRGLPVVLLLSLTTTEITPSIMIPDTITVFTMLLLGLLAAVALLLTRRFFSLRRKVSTDPSTNPVTMSRG